MSVFLLGLLLSVTLCNFDCLKSSESLFDQVSVEICANITSFKGLRYYHAMIRFSVSNSASRWQFDF